MHASEKLWRLHHAVAPYPPDVIPVPQLISGTAFFPGGRGVWQWEPQSPLPALPVGGVMVLGHDFHSETGYHASLARGWELRSQPTWRQLTGLLEAAGIPLVQCFFTNVYMGLRKGGRATGRFPGASDSGFVGRCLDFLGVQVGAFRPRIILTLGGYVPSLLARLSDDLEAWRGVTRLIDIDRIGPVDTGARIQSNKCTVRAAVAALTHPSQRSLNVRRRRYRNRVGHDAELLMLRDALGGRAR